MTRAVRNAADDASVRGLRHFVGVRNRVSLSALLALCLATALPAFEGAAQPNPTRLRFAPHSTPQARLAGYYVARARGFYRDRGLEVEILGGSPALTPHRLADGEADVASLPLITALAERDRGVPLVNVAQLVGGSSMMVIARRSSGIREPRDLDGRKVGIGEDELREPPLEFFQRYGVRADLVPLGSTVNLFLRGGVDATVALWSNEYHAILNAGVDPVELTTFYLRDHELDFPEEGIYCRAGDLARDPTPCRRFVEASLAGWREAFAHPDDAVALVMHEMIDAHLGTNGAHQRWMLARMRDLMPLGSGTLSPGDYRRTAEALRARGVLLSLPAYGDFHQPLAAEP